MTMLTQFFTGIKYFFKGIPLTIKPGIRRLVVLPLLINILSISTVIYYGWRHLGWFTTAIQTHLLPNESGGMSWLLWLIGSISMVVWLLWLFFMFIVIANLIAEPVNGKLAEAVEIYLTGKKPPSLPWYQFIWLLGRKLIDAIKRLLYYLFGVIGVGILSLIPPLTVVAPLLWFGFGAWMLALEYTNYPMDNHYLTFRQQRQLLARQRMMALGFGSSVLLMMMIPFINFLVMPVAVAGATCLWVAELKGVDKSSIGRYT